MENQSRAGSGGSAGRGGSAGSGGLAGPGDVAGSGGPAGPGRSAGSARSARSASGGWQWGRTAHTQRALLDAAREVFTSRGFADAGIADVVERAGSSVGSLYHHFGGKSELVVARGRQPRLAQRRAASKRAPNARTAGATARGELFAAGARAFLQGSW